MEKCIESIIECNLYQYTGNNPVVRVDPTGEFWHIAIGAGIGATFTTIDYFISTDPSDWDTGKAIGKAANGAIVGGLTAANPAAGLMRGLAKAGGAGFVGGVADDAIDKGALEIDRGSLESGVKAALSNSIGLGVGKGLEKKAKALATTNKPARRLYPTTSIRPDNPVTTYVVNESAEVTISEGVQQTVQDLSGASAAMITSEVQTIFEETGDNK